MMDAVPHPPADQETFRDAVRCFRTGRFAEAERICRLVLRVQPGNADALHLLGCVTRENPAISIALVRQALRRCPDSVDYRNNLAVALAYADQHQEALDDFRRVLEIDPAYAPAWMNLGCVLLLDGQLKAACRSLRRAVELAPRYAEAPLLLAVALSADGRPEEAKTWLSCALEMSAAGDSLQAALGSTDTEVATVMTFSAVLFGLHYQPRIDRRTLAWAAASWGACIGRRVAAWNLDGGLLTPDRRLRVGYVSGDFRRHPVGYFIEGILREHNRDEFEVFCYSSGAADDLQARLRVLSDHWRDLAGIDDDAAARLVRRDSIDLLIDLSGHTGGNRLGLFARKPAPVQATWLGYFDTTGLPTIDYLIADRHLCPAGSEGLYVEQVVRLPDTYLCYAPQSQAAVSPLPARVKGGFTFGCFNRVAKLSPDVLTAWASILRATPGSRLHLKDAAYAREPVRRRISAEFAARGITGDRLTFLGQTPYEAHLAAHADVDLALDPFPFNGGTTTVEALWMGVPVVTLAGDHFVSRMGVSHLSGVGLTELIATTPAAYVATTVGLAQDLPRLAALRAGLRDQMKRSPLCDGPRFTRDLETIYRQMWCAWCARTAAESVDLADDRA